MQNLDLKKINDRDCFGVVTTKRGKGEKRDWKGGEMIDVLYIHVWKQNNETCEKSFLKWRKGGEGSKVADC
jgi:hypothetical protein